MIIKPWPDFDEEVENLYGIEYKIPPRIIYHYTEVETAQKIIEGNSLNFSPPSKFNDPFGMYEGLIDFTATTKQMREWVKENLPSTMTRDQKRAAESFYLRDPRFKSTMYETTREIKKNSGVCCFSKVFDQTLMWSHYADKHKGICLGFNIQPFLQKEDFMVFEVNYPDEMTVVNYFSDRDKLLRHWFLTKMKAWEYEQEVRAIIRDTKGVSLFDFDRACLRGCWGIEKG